MFVRQLFDRDTSTYTYIIADEKTSEAAIIDPVKEQFERDVLLLNQLGFKLKYVLETHVHADHITSSGHLREKFSAQVALHENSGAKCADLLLKDGDVLKLGDIEVKAIHTPGHTNADLSFAAEGYVFTGDALLVRDCGRTDFQLGDSATLYHSINEKIFSLGDATVIYPGHDYYGFTASTVKEEKLYNNRLGNGKTEDEFVEIMANLDLALPKRIKESVPGNTNCGLVH
ncbi:MAG: MBL fold metallo-hydrolase [Gammaproteobacteria bacterium]|nr:MBL fold metallo-hydrolase [Gammaproteobacteria bacterium]